MRSKILLLSDDEAEREVIAGMLTSRQASELRVEAIETVLQGQEVLAVEKFAAVLFDIGLARADWQKNLRAISTAAGATPVLVLTGIEVGHEDVGAAAIRAGAHDYLVKNRINADVLFRIVRFAIERTQFQKKYDRLARQNSERRRMEEALRESQERIRAITESLFEGVLVTDGNGFIVFSNLSADSQLGDEQTPSIAGRFLDSIVSLRDGDRLLRFAESPFHRVVETGEPWRDDDAIFDLRN